MISMPILRSDGGRVLAPVLGPSGRPRCGSSVAAAAAPVGRLAGLGVATTAAGIRRPAPTALPGRTPRVQRGGLGKATSPPPLSRLRRSPRANRCLGDPPRLGLARPAGRDGGFAPSAPARARSKRFGSRRSSNADVVHVRTQTDLTDEQREMLVRMKEQSTR